MSNDVRIQIEVDSKTGEARVKALGSEFDQLGKKGKAGVSAVSGAFDLLKMSVLNVGTGLGVFSGVSVAALAGMAGKVQTSAFQMKKAFGDAADDMTAKAKQLSASAGNYYGLEEVQYAFVKTGDSMQRYGITGEAYINLVSRAMDVGAAKGLELKDSIDRIESAMRGEAEASEYLGVTLSDTYMKNNALNGSLRDSWEKLSDNEKAMHRYNEFMDQSGKYTGSAAEATKTFDGAMRELGNSLKTLVYPVLTDVADEMTDIVKAAKDLSQGKIPRAEGLRDTVATMKAGIDLSRRGLINMDSFAGGTFMERQQMVDQALARLRGQVAESEAPGAIPATPRRIGDNWATTTDYWDQAKWRGDQLKASEAFEKEQAKIRKEFASKAEQAEREAQQKADADRKLELQRREQFWNEAGAQHDAALSVMVAQSEMAAERELAVVEAKTSKVVQKHQGAFDALTMMSERTANAMEQNFSDFFFDIMTGRLRSLSDFGDAVLSSLARAAADVLGQMAKTAIFGQTTGGGGGGGGSTSGGLINAGLALASQFLPPPYNLAPMAVQTALSLARSERGNVFGPGGMYAFASGGVVTRPTVFPFAGGGIGLMGEAGPEAIMPLRRGADGKLGVTAGGGGQAAPAVIVNYAPVVQAIDTRSGLEFLAGHKNVIVGLVTKAANDRGRHGPAGW